jgi:hypothetical protein
MTTTADESTWQPAYPAGEGGNGNGNGNPEAPTPEGSNAGPRAPARTRTRGRSVWGALSSPFRDGHRGTGEAPSAPEDGRAGTFWEQRPPSPAEVLSYHCEAVSESWAAGRRWECALLDLPFAVGSVPATVVLYFAAFLFERKARAGVAAALIALVLIVKTVGGVTG